MNRILIIMVLGLLSIHANAENNQIIKVGSFSDNTIENWEQKSFKGNTQYTLTKINDTTVLQADSQSAASAFYRKIKIDLSKTPYLNWSWQKQNTLNPGDENTKSGDDFVARVYVVKDGGLFIWNTKALNYVWSYSHQQGDAWDNPFVGDKARMMAIRDQQDGENQWVTEKRNVVEDFKQQFGIDISEIDGVAIMTDTDNSNGKAAALYGDIIFTAE